MVSGESATAGREEDTVSAAAASRTREIETPAWITTTDAEQFASVGKQPHV